MYLPDYCICSLVSRSAWSVLDIFYEHPGFSTGLYSMLSRPPPLVVPCARSEICGGLSA